MSMRGWMGAAALAAAGVLAGCIVENPAPDSKLYYRFNHQELDVSLDGQQYIPFGILREHDSVYARAAIPFDAGIDSAEVYAYADMENLGLYDHYFRPWFPWYEENDLGFHLYAKVRPQADKSALPVIGVRENHLPGDIRRVDWSLNVLRAWRGKILIGSSLGGRYGGTWTKWDTSGHVSQGSCQGLIERGGGFQFRLQERKSFEDAWHIGTMTGNALGDSIMNLQDLNPDKPMQMALNFLNTSKVSVTPDSLLIKWIFPSMRYADSIEVRCARTEAR